MGKTKGMLQKTVAYNVYKFERRIIAAKAMLRVIIYVLVNLVL